VIELFLDFVEFLPQSFRFLDDIFYFLFVYLKKLVGFKFHDALPQLTVLSLQLPHRLLQLLSLR
jgi:hypothetical protein